jgi:hypothetical protein
MPSIEERLRDCAAESRAVDLYRALRDAVDGDPHWRSRAVTLLKLVEAGDVRMPAESTTGSFW